MADRNAEHLDVMPTHVARQSSTGLIYLVCVVVCLVEGFGLQSGGMGAPRFAAEFHMVPSHVGLVFLLTSLGLAVGASFGGWVGDRVGPGRAMAIALTLSGIASIGSALVSSEAMLELARTLVGFGLGGSLPNMVALLTATGPVATAPRRVMFSIAGISAGTVIVGLIALLAKQIGWRMLFHLGGWTALLVGVVVWFLLPKMPHPSLAPAERSNRTATGSRLNALFGSDHLFITLFFWLAFFVTSATSYVLFNWIPTFLTHDGLNQHQVGLGMMGLEIGAVADPMGLASLLRPGRIVPVVCRAYGGIVLGLVLLITAPTVPLYLSFVIGFTNFFVSGTTAILFGIVGAFYPEAARGIGIGSSVAMGRLGSGVGPGLAGVMLSAGLTQNRVLAAVVPMLVVALAVLLILLRNPPQALRRPEGSVANF
jgi:MFS transporter, AAHS family, 3-hydroxyphenylpropionic acid transporter